MGYQLREGFRRNGLPAGKRDFREAKGTLENFMFRDPKSLIVDALSVIMALIYAPFLAILRRFIAKPKSLRGKVCFVTGSGRGLGRGICIALAKEGAILACADINEEANSKTVEIMTGMGAKAKAYKLNVANKEEVDEAGRRVERELGRVYLLINTPSPSIPEAESEEEQTRKIFHMNTLAPIWTMGAFLPKMKEANDGHIVNICPGAQILEHGSAISCSMAAIKNYSQAVRLELVLQGYSQVHVTTVDCSLPLRSKHWFLSLRHCLQSDRVKHVNMTDEVDVIMYSILNNKEDVSPKAIMNLCNTLAETTPKLQLTGTFD